MRPRKMTTFFGSQCGWELQLHRHQSAPRMRWHIVHESGVKHGATSYEVALWRSLPRKMKEKP